VGKGKYETTVFDRARDELFSHIQRCGVLDADDEHRTEWLKDTTDYLRERYPELDREQVDELTEIGDRYCRPAIRHVEAEDAVEGDEADEADEAVEAVEGVEAVEAVEGVETVEAVETVEETPEVSIDSSSREAGEEKEVSVA